MFNAEYDHLVQSGFSRGSELGFPNRYIVKLRLTDAEQRKSLLQKWRYHLNKSEKAGLSFEYAPAERLPEFQALYERMLDRKKFADHSAYATLPALMAMEKPSGSGRSCSSAPHRRGHCRSRDLQGR